MYSFVFKYWNLYNRLQLILPSPRETDPLLSFALCAFSIEFQGSPISEEFAPLSDLQTPDSKRKKNDGEICADPNNIQMHVFGTHISTNKPGKQFIISFYKDSF